VHGDSKAPDARLSAKDFRIEGDSSKDFHRRSNSSTRQRHRQERMTD
jgi:hypothetical protein